MKIFTLSQNLNTIEPRMKIFFYGTIKRNPGLIKKILGYHLPNSPANAINIEKQYLNQHNQSTKHENITPKQNKTTQGLIFQLTNQELQKLKKWESSQFTYQLQPIQLENGESVLSFQL